MLGIGGKVLIVEDESAIAELIAINLKHHGYEIRHAFDTLEAEALLKDELPDLILLDWMLPGGQSGISYAKQLRSEKRTKDIPIIFLTARSEEDDKIAGLEAGGDDYVTKPFSPKELIARVKAVLRRRAPELDDDVLQVGDLFLDPHAHRVYAKLNASEVTLALGPTEYKLLRFLMAHPDRVHTREQLLNKVWGDHVFVEDRTVDAHIKRLRAALAPAHLDTMIDTVRGSGYRLLGS
jgi:two-component system phosphate regulon response regulator PhoB